MQSAKSLIEVTIWVVRWQPPFDEHPKVKFFKTVDSAENFLRELVQWSEKLGVTASPVIEAVDAEVE